MRVKTLLASTSAALLLTAALAGCSTQPSSGSGADASMSPEPTMSSSAAEMSVTGTLAGANGKNVAGTVTVEDGTVTLSGFSSDEGPDLHLYLANGATEAAVTAGTEIGAVKWDAASQTFTLPAGVHASDFTDLVVHCDKALAVFGAAPLS